MQYHSYNILKFFLLYICLYRGYVLEIYGTNSNLVRYITNNVSDIYFIIYSVLRTTALANNVRTAFHLRSDIVGTSNELRSKKRKMR